MKIFPGIIRSLVFKKNKLQNDDRDLTMWPRG
jgi:hypothetical protein